jgi:hypothetical protein
LSNSEMLDPSSSARGSWRISRMSWKNKCVALR